MISIVHTYTVFRESLVMEKVSMLSFQQKYLFWDPSSPKEWFEKMYICMYVVIVWTQAVADLG